MQLRIMISSIDFFSYEKGAWEIVDYMDKNISWRN